MENEQRNQPEQTSEQPKKDRAQIARENGAKSRGPVTPEGKARSSRNALKSGEHATKLELFVPPHSAVLCNEDRQAYAQLVDDLLHIYQPLNALALSIVQSIAIARWEIVRLRAAVTSLWNFALIDHAQKPCPVLVELAETHSMARVAVELYAQNNGPVRQINRQIDQLERRIAGLERRLKFVHSNFPNSEKRTGEVKPAITENTELTPETPAETEETEQPLFLTENKKSVIDAYRSQFPGRKIVVLNPDDVAKGIDIEDDMPIAPRKTA